MWKSQLCTLTQTVRSYFGVCSSVTGPRPVLRWPFCSKWCENIRAQNVSVFLSFLFLSASDSYYAAEYVTAHCADWKPQWTGTTFCFPALHVSTGVYEPGSFSGRVLVQLTSYTELPTSESLTFGWFIKALPQCFHLYLVFKSALRPVSSGTRCIRGESSKCHFFSRR